MLKTALLCGALLFANGDAPIENPTEPEIVEPNTGETTPNTDVETETTPNEGENETLPNENEGEETDKPITIPTPDDVKNTVEDWLSQWLSPQTIVALGSWLTFLSTALIFVIKWSKERKKGQLNNEQLEKDISALMKTEIGQEIKGQVEQFIPEILARLETQNDVLKTFAKILCLAQENTPESRVAILELIQNLGVIDKENVEASKKIVEEKEAEKVEKATKQDEELAKIIEDTEAKKDDGTTI